MTLSSSPVLPRHRQRLNLLRWWWSCRLGWPGAAAAVCIAVAAVLLAYVHPSLVASRADLLRKQVQQIDVLSRLRPSVAANSRDARDAWRDQLPGIDQRGQLIRKLLELAATTAVQVDKAEYTSEDQAPELTRVRVTIPIAASYAECRKFISAVLNGLPNASLDVLDIEGGQSGPAALKGQLRLSLYFRRGAP